MAKKKKDKNKYPGAAKAIQHVANKGVIVRPGTAKHPRPRHGKKSK